ncbi:hypothetical protein IRJ41_005596 [Triplophysa rosa]|uniref:Uncharacterized protein n=1 Tax=Triplophysa rosa TaxID=992332 RepID=A0A9W7WKC8_TRIRA|nr:hypothetical protein IRJ41_005596 [Triplophysa rosa]
MDAMRASIMASEATGRPRQLPAYLQGYQVSLPQSLMPYTAPNQDVNLSASAQQLQSLSLQTESATQDGQLLSALGLPPWHSPAAAVDKVSQWNTAPQVSVYPSLPTACGQPPSSALSECSRQSHTLTDYCLREPAPASPVYQPSPTVITPTCQPLAPPAPHTVLQHTTSSAITAHPVYTPPPAITAQNMIQSQSYQPGLPLQPVLQPQPPFAVQPVYQPVPMMPGLSLQAYNTLPPQYIMPQSPYSFQLLKQPVPVPELPKLVRDRERQTMLRLSKPRQSVVVYHGLIQTKADNSHPGRDSTAS